MRTMRLGELATYVNGRAFKPSEWSDVGVPIIRIENLNDTAAPFNRFQGSIEPKHQVSDGDLLVSWSASLDAYIWERGPAVLNQHIFKVSENPNVIERRFLYLALRAAMSEIRSRVHGATMRHVTKGEFVSVPIQVPQLSEQRRIAARLSDQLAMVDRARGASTDQITTVAALRTNAFERAFSHTTPLAVARDAGAPPGGWRWTVLTDLARLESGHTPSRSRPDWWGGDVGWIALPDIRAVDGRVITQTIETTNADGIAHSAARILPADTVVMSRTASVGFVARMGRPMATSQDFVNWVCGPGLDPEFLMYLLIRSRDYVRSLSSGAVHKTVYFPTVKAFRVCVPEMDAQRHVVVQLRERLAAIDGMGLALEAVAEAVDALPAALLRQAFTEA